MRNTSFLFLFTAILLSGCSKPKFLQVAAKQSNNSPTLVKEVCDLPQVSLSLVTDGTPLVVGNTLTFEVTASGCAGLYALAADPTKTFTSTWQWKNSYPTPGLKTERISILALDPEDGSTIGTATSGPLYLTILDVPSTPPTQPPPQPPLPPAPTCKIVKVSDYSMVTLTASFRFDVTGNATSGSVNGIPMTPGQIRAFGKNLENRIHLDGMVSGPGGTNFCYGELYLPPPGPPPVTYTVQSASGAPFPLSIPDAPSLRLIRPKESGDPAVATLSFLNSLQITKVVVHIGFYNTHLEDNSFELIAPSGKNILVHDAVVKYFDFNIWFLRWDLEKFYSPDPADEHGDTEYVRDLNQLNGQEAKGQWSLIARDWQWWNSGELKSWSLQITGIPR